jgi:hypothetical protein
MMKLGRLATLQYPMIALLLVSVLSLRGLAQNGQSHAATMQHEMTSDRQNQSGALINTVRNATARFQDVSVA